MSEKPAQSIESNNDSFNSSNEGSKVDKSGKDCPKQSLSVFDSTCLIVGTIVGSGIFITAKMTAANVPNLTWLILAWALGGLLALIGALCLSELATTYQQSGGDYIYLSKTYGKWLGFQFVWSEFWIVRAGNIGMMAVTAAIYGNEILPIESISPIELGHLKNLPYALASVLILGILNLVGIKFGKAVQNVLTVLKVAGLVLIVVVAFAIPSKTPAPILTRYMADDGEITSEEAKSVIAKVTKDEKVELSFTQAAAITSLDSSVEDSKKAKEWKEFVSTNVDGKMFKKPPPPSLAAFPFAMLFVMFTFGGWNDLAFVAGEVKDPKRNFFKSLFFGIVVVTLIYILVNIAYVYALGLGNAASPESNAIAADVLKIKMTAIAGSSGGIFGSTLISVIVCLCCLGAINAMIFTGARIYYASGQDHSVFGWLGQWNNNLGIPARSIIAQTLIVLALILICGRDESGFDRLLAVTSPFFYCFFLLVAVALFISRIREPKLERPFKVPLFPLTPILFCLSNIFMIYNTVNYAIAMKYFESFFAIGIVIIGFIVWAIQPSTLGKSKS